MKKVLLILIVISFCGLNNNDVYAYKTILSKEVTKELKMVSDAKDATFITAVEAQDQNGYKTRNLKIWGRQMANGNWYYFATTSDGTREFGIRYADNNHHKPFYVTINDVRWYFWSSTLDLYSGKTDQW